MPDIQEPSNEISTNTIAIDDGGTEVEKELRQCGEKMRQLQEEQDRRSFGEAHMLYFRGGAARRAQRPDDREPPP